MKNKLLYSKILLGAVAGISLIAGSQEVKAELIDGVNKEIICKRPKTTERQLKLHSCATMQYPLVPFEPQINPDAPPPSGPYSS